MCIELHRRKNTSILIPAQQRILSVFRLRLFYICPAPEKLLVREDAGELAGYGAVHEFHDVEICREEDVEVALMDLLFISPCVSSNFTSTKL